MIWAIGSLLTIGSLAAVVYGSRDAPVETGHPGVSVPDVHEDS